MTLPSGRQRAIALAVTVCVLLVALAAALNVGWIILTWRAALTLILGLLLFLAIITGLILNTIFLVREIRRNEQQDAFLNAMTHELKTPLASIKLYLETLQKRELEPEKRQEFYGVMLKDCDRLVGTIEQVLRAGRSSRSKRMLDASDVDLRGVVTECVEIAHRHHSMDQAVIELGPIPGGYDYIVRGDYDELRAAVSNLIDNAVKYSPQDKKIRVELSVWERGQYAIRVHDAGLGIPPDELKQIFKRFYRIPAVASRVKGTGLGLFIVNAVARKHGGRAFATSAGPGRGSTFTITLPAVAN